MPSWCRVLFLCVVQAQGARVKMHGGDSKMQKASGICPGSDARLWHAGCHMKVTFHDTDCAAVREEVEARLAGQKDWKDPHNGGTYVLTSTTGSVLKGTRAPGSKAVQATPDKFAMSFKSEDGKCIVDSCSETQVTSVLDFSTNYCNLHDLYCGSEDNCPYVQHDFKGYVEDYTSCRQNAKYKCTPETVVDSKVIYYDYMFKFSPQHGTRCYAGQTIHDRYMDSNDVVALSKVKFFNSNDDEIQVYEVSDPWAERHSGGQMYTEDVPVEVLVTDAETDTWVSRRNHSVLYFVLGEEAHSFSFTTGITNPECTNPGSLTLSVQGDGDVWEELYSSAADQKYPIQPKTETERFPLEKHPPTPYTGETEISATDVAKDFDNCDWRERGTGACADSLRLLAGQSGMKDLKLSMDHGAIGGLYHEGAVATLATSADAMIDRQFQASYMLSQVALNYRQCQRCMNFCAVCAAEDGSHKTVYLSRSKSRLDSAKMMAISPIDAVSGAVTHGLSYTALGAKQGAYKGTEAGVNFGINTASKINSGNNDNTVGGLGSVIFTALPIGLVASVATAPVGIAAGAIFGAANGLLRSFLCPSAGLTGHFTKCGRLGFVTSEKGKVSDTQFATTWFGSSGLLKLTQNVITDSKDVPALEHCKRLTDYDFDMRHMADCLKHTALCGHKGGFVLPRTGKDKCVEASGKDMEGIKKLLGDAIFKGN